MDRRVFLLLTLAGAADPAPLPPPLGPAAPASDTQISAPGPTGDPRFDAWRSAFMVRALAEGLPADVLAREFDGLTPDPRVLALETRQPEFSKPLGDYVRGVVSDDRVSIGRRKLAQLAWLPDVERRYGVPAEILLAIWAVETAFGTVQGDYDALRSLATLAASGHRQDWAETQLIALFRIIAEGDATRAQLRGSWTGALGQPQFEPTQYLSTAVDADGDGRRDIWTSSEDALASAANLLAQAGWRRGQLWAREMILPPGFDYGLAEGPAQDLAAWTALGLRTADGLGWSAADAGAAAVLLTPVGAKGPAFLALPNHFVIRQ
jgi:lytic murein transglycosylase